MTTNKEKMKKLFEGTLDALLAQVEQSKVTKEPLPVMVTTSIVKLLSQSNVTAETIEAEERSLAHLEEEFPFDPNPQGPARDEDQEEPWVI